MRSPDISMVLYACESCTLTAKLEKRTQAFDMGCYWRLSNILYKANVTNEEARGKSQGAIGEYDELLTLDKTWKLRGFGHVSRSSGLAKTILQGTVKGRRRGRQKRLENNITEWAGLDFASLTRTAENRTRLKGVVENWEVICGAPTTLQEYGIADMLSCYLFLFRQVSSLSHYLSSPPLLSSLPSESSRLLSCILLFHLLYTTSSSNLLSS